MRREMAREQPLTADESVKCCRIVPVPSEPRPRARRTGTIEITFGCGARVCVRGEVSAETLRQVIELLR
jgi:hypothetical protein